jgi:uncharacterized Tic20 family protein
MQRIDYTKHYSLIFRMLLFIPIAINLGQWGLSFSHLQVQNYLIVIFGIMAFFLALYGVLDKQFLRHQDISLKAIKWIYLGYAFLYMIIHPLGILMQILLSFFLGDYISYRFRDLDAGSLPKQANQYAKFTTLVLFVSYLLFLFVTLIIPAIKNPAIRYFSVLLHSMSIEYLLLILALFLLSLFTQWYFTRAAVNGSHYRLG